MGRGWSGFALAGLRRDLREEWNVGMGGGDVESHNRRRALDLKAGSRLSLSPMVRHTIVAVEKGRYHGWPANNGIWSWGNEILVGFTQGDYVQKTGHSIEGAQENHLAKSLDGGLSFEFLSWVTPEPKEEIAIMPQAVQLSKDRFVLAYRRILKEGGGESAIEMVHSGDRCRSWEYLSTVKITAPHHNSPALVRLVDGRLCCSYGDRCDLKIKAK